VVQVFNLLKNGANTAAGKKVIASLLFREKHGRQECLPHEGVRWVLFDAVGTLIYCHPPVADVYHEAGQRFGSRLTVAQIQQRFRDALAAKLDGELATSEANEVEHWRRLVGSILNDVPESGSAIFDRLWQHFGQAENWRLYDDVADTLAALAGRGYRLGIASNFDDRLRKIVRGHPPLALCEQVFVSSQIGYRKPDRRFFREVARRLDVSPAEIALVGDDELCDVQGARQAGWRAVRLDRGGTPISPGTIDTLAELAKVAL
jgi:putative hydrolase of the HAD superfamily